MTESHAGPTVLIVCTGNVCRSPYLERRLQQELDRSWGPGAVSVRSAGTGALIDAGMDPGSLTRLTKLDLDGSDFRSRALDKDILAEASLVITAERNHRTLVTRLHPRCLRTTHALRDLAQLAETVEIPHAPTGVGPTDWFAVVVPLLARQRGIAPPLPAEEADVIDPYRRDEAVFDLMERQIEDALPSVVRVLGKPTTG